MKATTTTTTATASKPRREARTVQVKWPLWLEADDEAEAFFDAREWQERGYDAVSVGKPIDTDEGQSVQWYCVVRGLQ